MDTGNTFLDKVYFCEIVKPREPEKPGGGASIWKRDTIGTFLRYLKSRYDTLKYCDIAICEL